MTSPGMPFVVGSPRSGTTLLRLMLDAHPDVAIPPETPFYPAFLAVDSDRPDWLEASLATITASPVWNHYGLDRGAFEARIRSAAPAGRGDILRAFYREYAARFGCARSGDKFPGNAVNMRRISALLPEARFIHIVRDGRDVAVSLRQTWFRPAGDYASCIALWADHIRAAREQVAPALPYLEVRYERLVREPEPALRRICSFLDLPFHSAMLHHHERAQERQAEIGDLVIEGLRYDKGRIAELMHTDRPPFATSIGRWRAAMSIADVVACERAAGDLLDDLGYR